MNGLKHICTVLSFGFSLLHFSIEPCLDFFRNHVSYMHPIAQSYGQDAATTAAIALPEVGRYEDWKNILETAALEKWYLENGSESADFSIGPFQMKPSFIEKLECAIVDSEELSLIYYELIPYGNYSQKERRKFRLENLKNKEFQFKYLCAFYSVMELKSKDSYFNTKEDKIAFFATAYNLGFDKKTENIKKWHSVKGFPFGKKYRIPQDAYHEISLSVYRNITQVPIE